MVCENSLGIKKTTSSLPLKSSVSSVHTILNHNVTKVVPSITDRDSEPSASLFTHSLFICLRTLKALNIHDRDRNEFIQPCLSESYLIPLNKLPIALDECCKAILIHINARCHDNRRKVRLVSCLDYCPPFLRLSVSLNFSIPI